MLNSYLASPKTRSFSRHFAAIDHYRPNGPFLPEKFLVLEKYVGFFKWIKFFESEGSDSDHVPE
ncbi:hypothetical protein CDAR_205041, partial [Caerostris darwini]